MPKKLSEKQPKTVMCDCQNGACGHPSVLMVRMETNGEPSVNYFCLKHMNVASQWLKDIADAMEVEQEDT